MGTMTTRARTRIILLCTIALAAALLMGCDDWTGDGDAKWQWQGEVLDRQRVDPPLASPTPERTE